jgi:endogenous inhibitor of DNA gyrase (YacG/DUF329 family)
MAGSESIIISTGRDRFMSTSFSDTCPLCGGSLQTTADSPARVFCASCKTFIIKEDRISDKSTPSSHEFEDLKKDLSTHIEDRLIDTISKENPSSDQ